VSTSGWTWRGDALLSDLDGVLVDSTDAVALAWHSWANRNGLDADAVVAVAHGVRAAETIVRFAPDLDADAEVAALEAEEQRLVGRSRPIPGARTMLAEVPAERLAIVTSGSLGIASARLRTVGLSAPPVLITADDVARGKPDPQGYLAAAAALGVPAERCLVVEDAPAGVTAAVRAGATVVAVTTSHATEELTHAHVTVPDPSHLDISVAAGGELEVRIR
jgi:mannitol-1-/sugar-/sorbitol-6-phosphatase